jgi:hypothetical protein
MTDLKSMRKTAQEILEDDQTHCGSASRTAMIISALALGGALLAAIIIHAAHIHNMEEIIGKLIFTLGGGGGGAYATKIISGIFMKGSGNAPNSPSEGGS